MVIKRTVPLLVIALVQLAWIYQWLSYRYPLITSFVTLAILVTAALVADHWISSTNILWKAFIGSVAGCFASAVGLFASQLALYGFDDGIQHIVDSTAFMWTIAVFISGGWVTGAVFFVFTGGKEGQAGSGREDQVRSTGNSPDAGTLFFVIPAGFSTVAKLSGQMTAADVQLIMGAGWTTRKKRLVARH